MHIKMYCSTFVDEKENKNWKTKHLLNLFVVDTNICITDFYFLHTSSGKPSKLKSNLPLKIWGSSDPSVYEAKWCTSLGVSAVYFGARDAGRINKLIHEAGTMIGLNLELSGVSEGQTVSTITPVPQAAQLVLPLIQPCCHKYNLRNKKKLYIDIQRLYLCAAIVAHFLNLWSCIMSFYYVAG